MIVIAATVSVPVMIMTTPPAIAFSIPFIEAVSVVMRPYPMRTSVRRADPVSVVPLVVVTCWIPVALQPDVLGPRAAGLYLFTRGGGGAPIRMPTDIWALSIEAPRSINPARQAFIN